MTDLTHYLPELTCESNAQSETSVMIKSGCSFEEVRELAMRNRSTHPDDPVAWMKVNDTYTLSRIVKS